MNLTSFNFFIFLAVLLFLFYGVAHYAVRPLQKYILLLGSIYFYVRISTVGKAELCFLIAYISLVTYIGALLIDKCQNRLKSTVLAACIVGIVGILVVLKYAFNMVSVFAALFSMSSDFSFLKFTGIIGISYYSLSAIGYLIDVYWGNCQAEKNIADVMLFIFYFPVLISGPVVKFSDMHKKLTQIKHLDYINVTYGMRRMAWGYFKKLVISERFAVIVATVYGDYESYSMAGIVLATICYAVQLYTDFSGCMDIIMGASSMFGITLPENFNAPFFSETIQEFWRRWHITLGVWFKDYLMYPLQKSKFVQRLGKKAKKCFGKKVGKKVPFYFSMIVLWTLIGIWHGGTGYYFIASAVIPCVLLILGDICQPLFEKIVKALNINTARKSWKWFRRIRTLLLICICWIVVCSNGTYNAVNIFAHMLRNPVNFQFDINSFGVFDFGIRDISMIFGIMALYLSDLYVYRGTTIFEVQNNRKFWFRIAGIYAELLSIMVFGVMGSSSFIYFKF